MHAALQGTAASRDEVMKRSEQYEAIFEGVLAEYMAEHPDVELPDWLGGLVLCASSW